MCSTASAYAAAGGADDPLISRSFVDNSYPAQVLRDPVANLQDSMAVLRFKLSQVSNSSSVAVKPISLSAKEGDSLTASTGASFTVFYGTLRVNSITGALIDVTSGVLVSAGQNLSAGHRYVCAESSKASLEAEEASAIGALGSVEKYAAVQIVFTDVPASQWYYEDVYYAVEKGLINGKTASTYDPDGSLTYAEAIKLASCMHQLYNTGSISLVNSSSGNWYDSYVDYGLENGIISAALSDYNARISRSDFVAIFYNSMPEAQYAAKNTVADNAIPDVKSAATHAKEIYAFYRAGILVGSDGAGTFYPDSSIKRSEVAAVLTRMYESSSRKEITL